MTPSLSKIETPECDAALLWPVGSKPTTSDKIIKYMQLARSLERRLVIAERDARRYKVARLHIAPATIARFYGFDDPIGRVRPDEEIEEAVDRAIDAELAKGKSND